jgi:hypothetical protein
MTPQPSQPTQRDFEVAKRLATTKIGQVSAILSALAQAREEGRQEERAECLDLARNYKCAGFGPTIEEQIRARGNSEEGK